MTRLAVCLFGIAALAGCSRTPGRSPVVVYSPHGKEMLVDYERRFEAEHPEIDVQWLDMGAQDAYDRVRTERENPQADVWWGGPMISFEKAAREGLLEPYTPSWDSACPADQRSRERHWYGTYLTPEVIMYNNRMLQEDEAPKDWDDLLKPEWKGRILVRYPLASGTMRIIFCVLIQREIAAAGDSAAGYRWLARLDENTKTYVADPTQLYLRIAREEAPLTLWNMPDAEIQARRSSQPFSYVIPSSGTPVITEGIAIVKGTSHPEQARAFYEYVTTREALVHQAREFFRIPTRTDLPPDSLPSWMSARRWKAMQVDWDGLQMHEQEWMRYWDEHVKGSGSSDTEVR